MSRDGAQFALLQVSTSVRKFPLLARQRQATEKEGQFVLGDCWMQDW